MFRFFFFKQKTAYEMRISDWSSDVCSSDLDPGLRPRHPQHLADTGQGAAGAPTADEIIQPLAGEITHDLGGGGVAVIGRIGREIGRASCRERVGQYV